MSKSEDLIEQYCPEGVEFKTLGKVCRIKTGEAVSKLIISSNQGRFPVINSGREPLGFIDKWNTEDDPIGITSRGAGVGSITWCEGRYYRGNLNYSATIKDEKELLIRFLYFILENYQTKIQALSTYDGIPALNKSNLEKLEIPVPPLEVQHEIVRILDAFTELEAELEAELEVRKKQYEYYRNIILTPRPTNSTEMKWVALGEIYDFQYGKGNTIPRTGGEYPVYGSNGMVGWHSEYNSENAPVIGHIGAYAGIVNWGKGKHFVTYNGVICKIKSKDVIPQYAYYLLLLQNFRLGSKNESQPFVSYDLLKAPVVPVPSLEEQERIVSILDKFDALVNDISAGLPAEIAARRQQYEYYRDKLLTFKEAA